MAVVVMALSTALVAEPALRRVEPVRISGPVSRASTRSARPSRPCRGAQVKRIVRAPWRRASARAPRGKGVTELAERAISRSSAPRSRTAARPSSSRSSAPSADRKTASAPPAMTARILSGSVPKVGGHSAASRIPRRPLVPAPAKIRTPPDPRVSATQSAAIARALR